MMIGGNDHILPWQDTPVLRDYVRRYFQALWPECVFIETPDVWFIHRDEASKLAWDVEGGTDDNQKTMVGVYFAPFTLVTDVDSTIPAEFRQNLEQHAAFAGFEPR